MDPKPIAALSPLEMPSIHFAYDFLIFGIQCVLNIFFKLGARGAHLVPKRGPVLFVAAPHSNQFVDPCMLQVTSGRRIGFLAAAKSMRLFWIGMMARFLESIPVERPQDLAKKGPGRIYWDKTSKKIMGADCKLPWKRAQYTAEFTVTVQPGDLISCSGHEPLVVIEILSDTECQVKTAPLSNFPVNASTALFYKITPKIDQSAMFEEVTKRFLQGRCVGIFPEGGSHDRPELLPLKAGAAIMALSSLHQYPDLGLQIVPVGLNYFHAEKVSLSI